MARQSGLVPSHVLKVSLDHVEPPVWRSFQIPITASLDDLHDVLQIVMGWQNEHLYEFEAGKRRFTPVEDDLMPFGEEPDEETMQTQVAEGLKQLVAMIEHPDEQPEKLAALSTFLGDTGTGLSLFGPEDEDTAMTQVGDLLKRVRSKMTYTYDFGDSWQHTIVVERSNIPTNPEQPAICLDGAGACPPEDSGGPWAYQNVVAAVQQPDDPAYGEEREWLGDWFEDFDPNRFDRDAVNRKLARLVWGLTIA